MKLKREIPASAIFGMGLTSETLHLDDERLRYEGIEHRWLIWRFLRIDRTVQLADITSFSRGYSIQPIFYILASICALNLLANLFGFKVYFRLPIWELPYLFVVSKFLRFIVSNDWGWLFVHWVTLQLYIGIIYLTRRRLLEFEIGHRSSIVFQADGIPEADTEAFVSGFLDCWNKKKENAT